MAGGSFGEGLTMVVILVVELPSRQDVTFKRVC